MSIEICSSILLIRIENDLLLFERTRYDHHMDDAVGRDVHRV